MLSEVKQIRWNDVKLMFCRAGRSCGAGESNSEAHVDRGRAISVILYSIRSKSALNSWGKDAIRLSQQPA